MPGVVSNPSPLPSAFTIHSDAEYEVTVGRKTSRSGSNDRGIIFRRKASSSILTIRDALHGGRYTRFFWNVLVFMMGVLGSPKLYSPLNPVESEICDKTHNPQHLHALSAQPCLSREFNMPLSLNLRERL